MHDIKKEYLKELRLAHQEVLENDDPVDLRVLSLGAGVQSSTIVFKILDGEIEPVDIAIFADTGNEPKEVYEWLDYLKEKIGNKFKVIKAVEDRNTGDITKDLLSEDGWFASIPAYTLDQEDKKHMLLRTCTHRYKILPIRKAIRDLLGVKTLRGVKVEMVMGISLDEIQRAKRPDNKWSIHCYPLIENEITRSDCLHYFKHNNLPTPPRSACIICPYHSNKEWAHLKNNYPDEFEKAVQFDEALRDKDSKSGFVNKIKPSRVYIHRFAEPLKDVDLSDSNKEEYQGSFFDDECEGMCGV